jgi:glycosyltransferase involved in cell wall biosynthesis
VLVKGPAIPPWISLIFGQKLGGWLRSLLAMAMIASELRRHPGTVAHFFLPAAYILGGLAAWFANAHPRIMSRRSLNRYQGKHPTYRKIEHFLHPKMDVLLGNSLEVVKELQVEVQGRTPVGLIYNGIESWVIQPHIRRQKRSELGLDNEILIVIIVANLIPYKGHADLINALALVKESLPTGWRLLCIGRDDGIGACLQELAKTLDIEANVTLLGSRFNVKDYLAAADLAVSASHEEGFSNAVLEAMMAGLPLVATDVGGNPEAVADGVTGYIVPSHNPRLLGSAILKLSLDPNRERMGAYGRERVVKEFSMKKCLDAYEALYFDLKSKRR